MIDSNNVCHNVGLCHVRVAATIARMAAAFHETTLAPLQEFSRSNNLIPGEQSPSGAATISTSLFSASFNRSRLPSGGGTGMYCSASGGEADPPDASWAARNARRKYHLGHRRRSHSRVCLTESHFHQRFELHNLLRVHFMMPSTMASSRNIWQTVALHLHEMRS